MDVDADIATKADWDDVRSLHDTPVPRTVVRAFVLSSRSLLGHAGVVPPKDPTKWVGPYTVDELADLFFRSPSTIYAWLDTGKLHAKRSPGGRMIDAAQVPHK